MLMSSASIMMANLYGYYDEYDKSKQIYEQRMVNKWTKPTAISEIYINGKRHRFIAGTGYKTNQQYQHIDKKLMDILQKLKLNYGYQVNEKLVTRELKEDETKESVMLRHSEKIALMFGLLNIQSFKENPIVINKNLRICQDCHHFIRLVSHLEQRKIIVSDSNRVHVFENGKCSCNEYY